MIIRRLIFAAVIVLISLIGSVSAQQLRDRELKPFPDPTTFQMPVEIVSIKLNGQEVAPREKIKANDDWLKGLSFTVKNVSDKPIAYIAVGLHFEPRVDPPRVGAFFLTYGVDNSRGEHRRGNSPSAILPDRTVDLVLTRERYPNFLEIVRQIGMPRSIDVVPYYVERVSFEDDPNVIWESGYIKLRNPGHSDRFDILEPYKLPSKH